VISPTPVRARVPDARRTELGALYRIALAVQRAVREAAGSPHRADVVAMGADGTPTEELDRLAESEILRTLDAEGLDWNVVSEEAGRVSRGGSLTLVVDPIDGTSNALRQLPFSTVSLALGSRDLAGIEVGLVRDLDRDTTYWGVRDRGAFRDGRPIRTRPWKQGSELLFVNLGHVSTARSVKLAGTARRIRSIGCASLEIAMVAQGSADAYLFENAAESRNLRATDIAAAYRILLEAGGGASTATGEPLGSFPLGVERRTSVLAWGDAAYGREFGRGASG
jgi:fructose-1,6-bisphosphatase/inositol monophosphatase family enzyme